jgi:transcriptional regulator with XRE-family HTH domain
MSIDVGARLRAVRKMRGFSQRELAKRVGVTNSTISLIEQNRVSPSVGSLKKVLDGIPMALADFFTLEIESGEPERFVYKVEEQPDLGNEGVQYFMIGSGRPDRQMCIMREVMAPGSDTGEEMLCHDGEEGGVVIQGALELTVGDRVEVLGPGEGYYFESSRPHRFRNVGDNELVIVSANTPPSF